LSVHHRYAHGSRLGQAFGLGQHVQRRAVARGMVERGHGMGLASAERRHELQHRRAALARQALQHVFKQRLQARRNVRRAEERFGVAVDRRDRAGTVGQRPQVQREDVGFGVLFQHVGVQVDGFKPGFRCHDGGFLKVS